MIKEVKKEDLDILDFKVEYTTDYYYDVIRDSKKLFSISLERKKFEETKKKSFDFTLFSDYLEEPRVFIIKENDIIVSYLEVSKESWSQRLRISELYVEEEYRQKGYGTKLLNKAFDLARELECRECVLETQSCNDKAISAYLKNGFIIQGIDLSHYSNSDVKDKEVRLEMVKRV